MEVLEEVAPFFFAPHEYVQHVCAFIFPLRVFSAGGGMEPFISQQSSLPVSTATHLGCIRSDPETLTGPNLKSQAAAGQILFSFGVHDL